MSDAQHENKDNVNEVHNTNNEETPKDSVLEASKNEETAEASGNDAHENLSNEHIKHESKVDNGETQKDSAHVPTNRHEVTVQAEEHNTKVYTDKEPVHHHDSPKKEHQHKPEHHQSPDKPFTKTDPPQKESPTKEIRPESPKKDSHDSPKKNSHEETQKDSAHVPTIRQEVPVQAEEHNTKVHTDKEPEHHHKKKESHESPQKENEPHPEIEVNQVPTGPSEDYIFIDLPKEIEYITQLKKEANKKMSADKADPTFENQIKEAIVGYNKAIDHIHSIFEIDNNNARSPNNPSLKANEKFKDLFNEYKLVNSNLAFAHKKIKNYAESASIDEKIIRFIDNGFDKSYARLIDTFIMMNELGKARYYYNALAAGFTEDVVRKYPEIIELLTKREREQAEKIKKERESKAEAARAANANASKSPESASVEVKKEAKSDHTKKSQGLLPKWVHYLFSGVLIFGSSFAFYYFYKNRAKFQAK